MFIDVCFPKNNEFLFLKRAELLGIGGLLFVYENHKKQTETTTKLLQFSGYYAGKNNGFNIIETGRKKIWVYDFKLKRNITQVLIKEIPEDVVVGLPLGWLFSGSREVYFGDFGLLAKICEKQKLSFFSGSMSFSTETLIGKDEAISVLRKIGVNQKTSEQATKTLFKILNPDQSANFL